MKTILFSTYGSSNIAASFDMGGMSSLYNYEIVDIKIHLSTAATASNTLTVRQRSHISTAYDNQILAVPMNGVQDVFWNDGPYTLNGKDRISVIWTNDAASFKTYGIQIGVKEC